MPRKITTQPYPRNDKELVFLRVSLVYLAIVVTIVVNSRQRRRSTRPTAFEGRHDHRFSSKSIISFKATLLTRIARAE